jgi:hypothetical protein
LDFLPTISLGTCVWSGIAVLGEILALCTLGDEAVANNDEFIEDANDVFLLCRDGFAPAIALGFDFVAGLGVVVIPGRGLQTRISTRSPG